MAERKAGRNANKPDDGKLDQGIHIYRDQQVWASLGDTIDGSNVTVVENVPDSEGFTFDILPAGDTEIYRGNGIPLRSTLF